MDNTRNTVLQELDSLQYINSFSCLIEHLEEHLPARRSDFSFIIQNIRSVHKSSNIDDLDINLSMYSHPIDIIILTECRINNSKPLPLRPNYTTHSTTTKSNQNDGVVAIVNNSIAHSVREAALYGASCLEITLPNYKIVCIYRSPSEKDASKFIHSLDTYLSLPHMKTNVILTGDININIKVDNKDKYCDQYLDMLASHNLLPGHRLNTRINSCLDHIICNIDSTKVDATVVGS